MTLYKLKTGLVPFPNAANLTAEVKTLMKASQFEKSVLFFLLGQFNDESPFKIFQEDPSLLNFMKIDKRFESIIHEGLLNLNKDTYFQSSIIEEEKVE